VLATSGVQAHIKEASGCFDVFQVSEYRGSRIRKDGAHQVLTIRVFDSATESEHPRFHVEVEADDGARTTGHPAHSLEGALKKVAWEDLDP
jgi:hypothetical protein